MSDQVVQRTDPRLGQLVLDELKERLLDGRYLAGSRVSINDVKAEFGAASSRSWTPCGGSRRSESSRSCRRAGAASRRTPCVRSTTTSTCSGRFEGEIAAAAASSRRGAQIAELGVVWQPNADLEVEKDTITRSRGYRFLNREFHLVIHEMVHSRVMPELSERMWDMGDFFVGTVGGSQHLSDAVGDRNHDHDVTRGAIRSRSSEIARVAMQSHIVETVGLFSGQLDYTA